MSKEYIKINNTQLEEKIISTRTVDREFLENELKAIKENIKAFQEKKNELEGLLKQLT